MQSRVADLIERCQDEIILESTLQINDELNSVFVRYERWATLLLHVCTLTSSAVARYLRNREALQQPAQEGEERAPEPVQEGDVATTSLNEVCALQLRKELLTFLSLPQPSASISYPSLDDQQPPAYEGDTTVGTLIDLGSDITAPLTSQLPPGGQDIVTQLADMGVTGGQAPPSQSGALSVEQSHDEFDMFAKSRTAYAGSTGY